MHGGRLSVCARCSLWLVCVRHCPARGTAALRRMLHGSARSLGQAGARHSMRSARRRRSHACVLCLDNHVACRRSPPAACAARTSRSAASGAAMAPARRGPSDRLRRHVTSVAATSLPSLPRHFMAQRPSPRRNRCRRRIGAAKRRGVRRGRADRSATARGFAAGDMQLTADNRAHAAHSMQQTPTTCNGQHAADDMQLTADSVHRTASSRDWALATGLG